MRARCPQTNPEVEMNAEIVKVGQLEIRYLVHGTKNEGLGVFEMKVPPAARVPPPHSHSDNEEFVFVLDGVLRYRVNGDVRDLRPGEWMATPRGAVHHFSNQGSEPARALVVLTPDIGVQFFRDVGALAGGSGPPDRAKLLEVMSRYGLVPGVPPKAPRSEVAASAA